MKHLNLRRHLLLITLLPSTLIAVMLVVFFTSSSIDDLEKQMRNRAIATVRHLAPISEYSIIAGQMDSLNALVQATMQEPGVKAVLIVTQKGRTLAVSGRVSLPSEQLRHALPAPTLVAETASWLAYGAPVIRSQNEVDPLFEFQPPANTAAEAIGHVFVEFDKRELVARQDELFRRGALTVLLGLSIMSILAIVLANSLARPLERLTHAVRQMSSRRFDTRVAAVSSGELRVLENGFNEMAEHIEEMHRSLQSRIEEATAQLAFQARHDALTGLINRREFETQLQRVLAIVQAGGDECCMLFIDLDRFKPVNDSCGHLAGDELLRQIALLFRGRLREEDTLGRLGGDEFGIILAHSNSERAHQVASDLCALAAEYRFIWHDKIFSIGASIGLTPLTRHVRDIRELLAASDAACQEAKELGRNRVCERAAGFPGERRSDHGNWASRLASALADGRVLVEVQPLRALQTGAPREFLAEVTARLNEAGQAPIALTALIDAAERYDLATRFDRHFLEVAITALARAAKRNRPMRCLVPLSRTSILDPGFFDWLSGQLGAAGISGSGLALMFPEDISTHQTSQVIEFSRRVRSLGCRIALDDFGGGMSSFNALRSIEPAYVKLSPSLTRDVGDNRTSTALLRAVVEISRENGIQTIAGSVDDSPQLQALEQLGLSYAQGKAIAPREPFAAWFEGAVMRGAPG